MCYKNLIAFCVSLCPIMGMAQFYTITKEMEVSHTKTSSTSLIADNQADSIMDASLFISENAEIGENLQRGSERGVAPKCDIYLSSAPYAQARGRRPRRAISNARLISNDSLPDLTIPNLIIEIKRHGIKHPKIVLAQAILETGWFTSSVCKNKNNLFGLTNPRTKTYYEFNHWTESVAAYYNKVQYRYKGGNYLIWLRDIGYAEDPGYIRALIRLLRQL